MQHGKGELHRLSPSSAGRRRKLRRHLPRGLPASGVGDGLAQLACSVLKSISSFDVVVRGLRRLTRDG